MSEQNNWTILEMYRTIIVKTFGPGQPEETKGTLMYRPTKINCYANEH